MDKIKEYLPDIGLLWLRVPREEAKALKVIEVLEDQQLKEPDQTINKSLDVLRKD